MRLLAAATVLVVACSAGRTATRTPGDTEPGLPPPPAGSFGAPVTVVFDAAPPLRAEVASRPDQRARGLMQRRTLPNGTGMIFIFSSRTTAGFYMRGTLIPLSIAYVDGDTVVSTAEMTPCPPQTDCPVYQPAGPYTIAVEAAAGFFPRWGVVRGTRMRVTGVLPAPQG